MEERKGLPLWAKILIGVVLFVGIGAVAITWIALSAFKDAGKRAADPASTSKLAHEIVDIDEPLPAGWRYAMNVNMGELMRIATLHNADSTVVVNLTKYPNKLSHEVATGQAKGAGMTVSEEGEDNLAGHPVKYLRGPGSLRGRPTFEQIWYATTNDGKGSVTVHVFELGKSAWDGAAAHELTDHIHSLH
jgi:hypothetical protein